MGIAYCRGEHRSDGRVVVCVDRRVCLPPGAAANHIREMVKDKNFHPGNTIINISNIGPSVSLWALLFATGAI